MSSETRHPGPLDLLMDSIRKFEYHTKEAERHARGILYYVGTYFPDFEKFEEYRQIAMKKNCPE